jgi:hypothetical protein
MGIFRQFLNEAGYLPGEGPAYSRAGWVPSRFQTQKINPTGHPRVNQASWARPDWIPPNKVQASPEVQLYKASRMGTGLDVTPPRTESPERGGFYPLGGRADQTRSLDMDRAERERGTQSPFTQGPNGIKNTFYSRRYAKPGE